MKDENSDLEAFFSSGEGYPLNEATVILLGDGAVGKTSLVRRLANNSFDPNQAITEGISIYESTIKIQNRTIHIDFWDFDRQEIYHATHEFFLSKRSLYLLVADSRLPENNLEYYLQLITAYAGNSPVILVGTKIDERPFVVDERGLQNKYPQIVDIIATSSLIDKGIDLLRDTIAKRVANLPGVNDLLPNTWLKVKQELKTIAEDYISIESYYEVCISCGVENRDNQNVLLRFLHDLGKVLHFSDVPVLFELVILNPSWVTEGIYSILNNREITENSGVFDVENLAQILPSEGYPTDLERNFILELLQLFERAFRFPDKENSNTKILVPELLPIQEPEIDIENDALRFEYHYNILPTSIIARLIARLSPIVYQNTCWRNGVLVAKEEHRALVKADRADRIIYILVDGKQATQRRSLLTSVRREINTINLSLPNLKIDCFIPLPNSSETIFSYNNLLRLEQAGKKYFQDPETFEEVNVRALLDSVLSEAERKAELEENQHREEESSSKENSSHKKDENQAEKIVEVFSENVRPASALNDRPIGPDKLNFDRYADAFARLLLNTETKTPLTIGIYGAWGMGKSFLMKKIREKMEDYLEKDQKKRVKTFIPWRYRSKKHATRPASDEIDFHFVEFNAWVYSGSETLWAGFVTHLYSEIEKYLGELVAFSFRLGKSFRRSLYNTSVLLLCFGVLGFGLSLLLDFEKIEKNWNALQIAFNSFWATAIGGSALVGLRALIFAIRDLSESVAFSRAMQLRKLSSKHDFQNQIGFMADIKDEMSNISQLLKQGKQGRSTRVVIFIDDLDRCPHKKAVEVLQAIMLLLADEDGAPFIVFLGLDARVIVRAIEEEYGEVLVNAGITGYEYLDKIVQIPFSLPLVDSENLKGYVDSLLWNSDEEQQKFLKAKLDYLERTIQRNSTEEETIAKTADEAALDDLRSRLANQQNQISSTNEDISNDIEKGISVILSENERQTFSDFTRDLLPNPRRIKRMVNIYRYIRQLVPSFQGEQRRKLIRWIILTEQWPFRAAWMLEKIDNDFENGDGFFHETEATLKEVYESILDYIYSKESNVLITIDGDPERFLKFLQGSPILTVADTRFLRSLTYNLNPAIRSEVSKLAVRNYNSRPGPL